MAARVVLGAVEGGWKLRKGSTLASSGVKLSSPSTNTRHAQRITTTARVHLNNEEGEDMRSKGLVCTALKQVPRE